jgi:predicted helicase
MNVSTYIDPYVQTLRVLTDKVDNGIVTMVVNNSFLLRRMV